MKSLFARFSPGLSCLCLVWLLAGTAPLAAAPEAGGAETPLAVNADVIEARLKEVEASSEYDDRTRTALLELYRKALTSLETAQTHHAQADRFAKARDTAATEAKAIREALQKRQKTDKLVDKSIAEGKTLADIEAMLLEEKADYTAVDARLSSLETQLDSETSRPEQARKRLTEARQQFETLNAKAAAPPPPDQQPQLGEARRWNRQAQIEALSSEIAMLDQELLSRPMRLEQLKAERDRTVYSLRRIGERVNLLETLVSEQRRSEVEQARADIESAEDEASGEHPLIQDLAEKNQDASQQLAELTAKLEKVVSGDQVANERAKRVEDEFRNAQTKLEVAGLSQALGQVLVEQRRQLPNVQRIQKDKRTREKEISATALDQIQVNEELRQLADLDTYVDALLAGTPGEIASGLREDLLTLAESRRNLLSKSVAVREAYLRALGELDYAQTRLIKAVQSYDAFLAEHLLWIRSAPAPSLAIALGTPEQIALFLSPANWLNIVETLFTQLQGSPLPLLGAALIVILLFKQRAIKRLLVRTGKQVVKPRSDNYRHTLLALALTVALAAPWPLLLELIGWVLGTAAEADIFTKGIARSLSLLTPAFFYLNAFRHLCRAGGLAEAHFRWSVASTRALRKQISLLMATFLPAAVVAITSSHASSVSDGALGRIAFIVIMGSLSYFFYRLFGPKNPVLDVQFRNRPDSLLTRYRYLWMTLSLILPLLLVILAISGFMYTAATLTGSLIDTLWLILGFLVVHQMAVRWLVMVRRKLDFQAAIERRRAALAADKQQPGESDEHTDVEEPEVDLKALNDESRKLLNSAIVFAAIIGLWFIWSDVLPAFRLLDEMALWHHTGTVDGEEKLIPVTLADLILALIIVFVTVVASKRFPSLLEIVLLRRFEFTAGGRYAATTLSRYVIAASGVLMALSTIGASWSQLQWLAAALGVGIGFGLQEIVANFISGIIILFERPIRVGDVVTVGDVDGVVTRIQIRATTIRTWDRFELLVPNKEFITSRLLNWSLSDQTTRLRIPVGIAYGADVALAMKLLREVADRHPRVLKDPEPFILFDAFGDNSLNLELRCFVSTVEDRLPVHTELHQAINEVFNANDIVIAFPQRDVHLDTTSPLEVRIRANDEAPQA